MVKMKYEATKYFILLTARLPLCCLKTAELKK